MQHASSSHGKRYLRVLTAEAPLLAEVARFSREELDQHTLLSSNAKVGATLDFPIGQTCRPTPVCGSVCYAAGGRTSWSPALLKRLRTYAVFRAFSTEVVTWKLRAEHLSVRQRFARHGARYNFIRWNGSGDLFPEAVAVINRFSALESDIRMWVVTRKLELAAEIIERPNVFLQLSLDRSTSDARVRAATEFVEGRSRAYLSYLRTGRYDDRRAAAVVFPVRMRGREEFAPEPRVDCPADAGRLPLDQVPGLGGLACSRCRRCFSDRTLRRQREELEREHATRGGVQTNRSA